MENVKLKARLIVIIAAFAVFVLLVISSFATTKKDLDYKADKTVIFIQDPGNLDKEALDIVTTDGQLLCRVRGSKVIYHNHCNPDDVIMIMRRIILYMYNCHDRPYSEMIDELKIKEVK